MKNEPRPQAELTGDLSTKAVMQRQSERIHLLTGILVKMLENTDFIFADGRLQANKSMRVQLNPRENAFVQKLIDSTEEQ